MVITASKIREALKEKYSDPWRYAICEEVKHQTDIGMRRLDVFILHCWESERFMLEGVEIKASRSDFRREFEDNQKHSEFYKVLDMYSICAPKDVIDKDIIPRKWGIYSIDADTDKKMWELRTVRRPLDLHDGDTPQTFDRSFVAHYSRMLCHQIAHLKKELQQKSDK